MRADGMDGRKASLRFTFTLVEERGGKLWKPCVGLRDDWRINLTLVLLLSEMTEGLRLILNINTTY